MSKFEDAIKKLQELKDEQQRDDDKTKQSQQSDPFKDFRGTVNKNLQELKKELKENPMGLRRVIYKKWITAEYEEVPDGRKVKEGTNIAADTEGFFHGFGTNFMECNNGVGMYTCAIVEHIETGTVSLVHIDSFKFVKDETI